MPTHRQNDLVARPLAPSVDALLRDASKREPLPHDGKSGALLERVEIDGEHYVLKHIDLRHDWIMRQAGDLLGYAITVWASGVGVGCARSRARRHRPRVRGRGSR